MSEIWVRALHILPGGVVDAELWVWDAEARRTVDFEVRMGADDLGLDLTALTERAREVVLRRLGPAFGVVAQGGDTP